MEKKWLVVIIFILLFSFQAHSVCADEIEGEFKNICLSIKPYVEIPLEEIYKGYQGKSTNKDVLDKVNRLPSLSKGWQDQLKILIKQDPNSIWADDSQYIIAILSAGDYKQEALELEYLLKKYPNVHIEDYTKEILSSMVPSQPELAAKVQLCFDYKQLGETEKLKQLCEDSIKKYPDRAKIFEKFMQTATIVTK